MERPRHFAVPALAAFLLAFAWLLAHAYARQQQAHVLCPTWPECYLAPSAAVVPEPPSSDDIGLLQALVDGVALLALVALAALGWKRREATLDRRWGIPVMALALVGVSAVARLAYIGPGVLLWQWLAPLAVCVSLWWLVLREQRFLRPLAETGATRALRPRVLVALFLALLAALTGGWASAHGIGLPCPDFPSCRGAWWPAGDLLAAVTAVAARPDEATAVALAVSHRLAALTALIYVMWLGLHLWRTGTRDHLCRYGLLVLGALLLTAAVGIMGAVTRLMPATVVAHGAAGALLVLSLATLYHGVRPQPGRRKREHENDR